MAFTGLLTGLVNHSTESSLRFRVHQASYRDCTRQRPAHARPIPGLDSCASIRVSWPIIPGKPGINAHLLVHLLSLTGAPTPYLRSLKDLPAGLRQCLQQQDGFAAAAFSIRVVSRRQGILLLENRWSYDGGGAHPDQGSQYYLYDVSRDRSLTLADLLVAGYASPLQEQLRRSFGQQPNRALLNEPSELPLTTNWLLTRQGIRFHYNAGQAGAVAAGPVDVLVNWSQLKSLLRRDGLALVYERAAR